MATQRAVYSAGIAQATAACAASCKRMVFGRAGLTMPSLGSRNKDFISFAASPKCVAFLGETVFVSAILLGFTALLFPLSFVLVSFGLDFGALVVDDGGTGCFGEELRRAEAV